MTKINGNILDQTCPDYTITISKQTADILRQRRRKSVFLLPVLSSLPFLLSNVRLYNFL